jgi:ATP synthase H subunit
MSEQTIIGPQPEEQFSHAVSELAQGELQAVRRVENANSKKQRIIALARQKAQEMLQKARDEAAGEKARLVARAQEKNLAEAKRIVEKEQNNALKLKGHARKRIPACTGKLYRALFE